MLKYTYIQQLQEPNMSLASIHRRINPIFFSSFFIFNFLELIIYHFRNFEKDDTYKAEYNDNISYSNISCSLFEKYMKNLSQCSREKFKPTCTSNSLFVL